MEDKGRLPTDEELAKIEKRILEMHQLAQGKHSPSWVRSLAVVAGVLTVVGAVMVLR